MTALSEVAGIAVCWVIWEKTSVVCLGHYNPLDRKLACGSLECGMVTGNLWVQLTSASHHSRLWLRLWSVFRTSWSWKVIDINTRMFCWHILSTHVHCHILTSTICVSRIIVVISIVVIVLFAVNMCSHHMSSEYCTSNSLLKFRWVFHSVNSV